MKSIYKLLAALVLLSLFSCSRQETDKEITDGIRIGETITIKASLGEADATKTAFQSDGESGRWPVEWLSDDAINVFYGNKSSGKFTTSNSGPIAEFTGTLSYVVGSSDENGGMESDCFWGIYPYNENNTCDGSSVTITIPSVQTGVPGTFADDLNPTVACSTTTGLCFYNVGGWVMFTVTQPDIVSASLTGANGENLAGEVKVSMDENGKPRIDQVISGAKSVILTPKDGTFKIGETYCFVILPQSFKDGLILTFFKEDGYCYKYDFKTINNTVLEIARSGWKGRKSVDKDASFVLSESVDLGLSVKWATCNLGASIPEEYGDYYAWGEISSKPYYDWSSYIWCNGSIKTLLTKYCPVNKSDYWGKPGTPDGKMLLDLDDDAAHVNLGGSWRMPTDAEWTELLTKCTWKVVTLNGVPGRRVTGPNGNSIFLPAAGAGSSYDPSYVGTDGNYWSSSLGMDYPLKVWCVTFNNRGPVGKDRVDSFRFRGLSVRPVTK